MSEKISIITINYNNAAGLRRTMDSMISQTGEDFEYIVIDGGSKDESVDIIKENADHMSFWISEPDRGVYHAMNKGIQKATGDYILFMNSGDHFLNEQSLESATEHLGNHDVVCFDWKVFEGDKVWMSSYPETLSFFDFYRSGLPHQSTFIRTELFRKYGLYDESLKIVADWKFFMEAFFKHAATYLKVTRVLSCYYFDGISSVTSQSEERERVLKESFPYFVNDVKKYEQAREAVLYIRYSKVTRLLNLLKLIKLKWIFNEIN